MRRGALLAGGLVAACAAASTFALAGTTRDGDPIDIGNDTYGGTVVAHGRLAAGFERALEEDGGGKLPRSLGTMCIFSRDGDQLGGGGCGFDKSASINDEGCGDTSVFGAVPLGGRAVVAYMDGHRQAARLYPAPHRVRMKVAFFYATRKGVHTVRQVSAYSRSGSRIWTQREGPDDLVVKCE